MSAFCTQLIGTVVETLPKMFWTQKMHAMRDPVVRMRKKVYGEVDSGDYWGVHFLGNLTSLGWSQLECCHPASRYQEMSEVEMRAAFDSWCPTVFLIPNGPQVGCGVMCLLNTTQSHLAPTLHTPPRCPPLR